MRPIRLEIAYDGAPFSGWQVQSQQPHVRTVQGELQRAVFKITGNQSEVIGSGRTDAGVHALCQTALFRTDSAIPIDRMALALNAELPPAIRVLRAAETADDFHPIRDVVRKRYRYLLSDAKPIPPHLRDRVWFVLRRLDFDAMEQGGAHLLGTHDFASFQTVGSPRKSTVRTVFDLSIKKMPFPDLWSFPRLESGEIASPNLYAVEVEADGFLYNMVRAIAGTLAAIGQHRPGFEAPERMREILESKNRSLAGPTAPAHALYMLGADYGENDRFGQKDCRGEHISCRENISCGEMGLCEENAPCGESRTHDSA